MPTIVPTATAIISNLLPIFQVLAKRLAVCESQPNMVYMVSVSGGGGCLNEVQRSTDGGSTWTKIGEGTESFEPMGNTAQCQGDYDLALPLTLPMATVFSWRVLRCGATLRLTAGDKLIIWMKTL
ncbi:MAG: hypothetical protein IPL35_17670 [Sphingobacteriales bacterium]|nr:hypothetical protein [Sphingobacteriales bacterium]